MVSLENAKAILLAAGKGVRMKSERAKVLQELLGRPLIYHVLRAVRTAGLKEITVVTGHQEEAVRAAVGEGVVFVRQAEQKGTGHAVQCCEPFLRGFGGDLLVMPGDAPLVMPATLASLVERRRVSGAACVVLTACLDDPRGYGRIVRDSSGGFERIVEQADASESEQRIQEANSSIYAFDASALWDALREIRPNPRSGEIYLTDVLAALKSRGQAILTQRSADACEIYGINTRRDLVAATNFLRWRLLELHLDNGVAVVDPSTTYIEDGVTIGPDTTVRPYTVIEHDVVIGRGCDVGPFAHLRPGTVLEDRAEVGNFVEVKKSRLGRSSKAKHLAYLGDASLGEGVNIGAGTITANYDGRSKHQTVIEDGVHVGSNTVLVAPVRVGKGATTGAGAVVLAGRDVAAGDTVAGVPARSLRMRQAADKAEEPPRKAAKVRRTRPRGNG
ncbi:MAG: bifunctional N-acetylglucosamine-1-phosphate uridyltransferase/glucosamine-1-phosphate acetyltransferase [Planctomycetes bacterium]|nr:bifunctional N-acetylglucosamine-1-phosphate uridyltransferase/glucosamine-1-phosphate acetyltransferase [Planctomycetota bacterium]